MTTETKTTYIAFDGTRFQDRMECEDYESEKMENFQGMFDSMFTYVNNVSDEMKQYVIWNVEAGVYRFICFDGWELAVRASLAIEDLDRPEQMTDGKVYFLFKEDDENRAIVVDPEHLKKEIASEIDSWGKF